ncbi:15046_t:CDS:2 [Gigaspora rosea]|nr:15046_t:CDS:2 [Gigaspora rosea]
MTDIYAPVNDMLNPKTIKNLLDSSDVDSIKISDSSFKYLIWDKNWVRTDESVSFARQQIEQLLESQIRGNINHRESLDSLLQNHEVINFSAGKELHVTEIAFKVDPDFPMPMQNFICYNSVQTNHKSNEALLSNTFNHGPKVLYEFCNSYCTPGQEEFS